ncbi:MAG: DegT/DnrJ/EryC1/StrS family aminotransferase [Bacteroidia bacterium]|nr:DegT/DnrJ/EryC1/StrS family aminotransferase [Bacteroidia bacterium]
MPAKAGPFNANEGPAGGPLSFLSEPNESFFSNHWLTTILIDPALTGGITREDLRLFFESRNIESRPLWKPMHLQPVFRDCPAYIDGTSEHLFNHGLCLPSGSNITDEERQFVVDSIHELINHKSQAPKNWTKVH